MVGLSLFSTAVHFSSVQHARPISVQHSSSLQFSLTCLAYLCSVQQFTSVQFNMLGLSLFSTALHFTSTCQAYLCSVQHFTSVQHARPILKRSENPIASTPSFRSFPNAAFKTVPTLVWSRIHVGRMGYPPTTLSSKIRPLGQYSCRQGRLPSNLAFATRRITPTAPSVFRGRIPDDRVEGGYSLSCRH